MAGLGQSPSFPKAEQQAPQWLTAAEMLLLNAEHGGDLMFARIAMMKALHRHMSRPELHRAASGPKPTGLCGDKGRNLKI
jgi:hypothetical protein